VLTISRAEAARSGHSVAVRRDSLDNVERVVLLNAMEEGADRR
jgi:hypothetical protein